VTFARGMMPGGLRSFCVVLKDIVFLSPAASRALSFPHYASASECQQRSGRRLQLLSSAVRRVDSLLGKLKRVLSSLRDVRY